MRRDHRREPEALEEMRWAVERLTIEMKGVSRGRFEGDESKRAAVAFYLMALGDAASEVSERTQHAYPGIPWDGLRERRYNPAHRPRIYLAQDVPETWVFLRDRLPRLVKDLKKVRPAHSGNEPRRE